MQHEDTDAEVIDVITDALGDEVEIGRMGRAVLISVSNPPAVLDTPEMRDRFIKAYVKAEHQAESAPSAGAARQAGAEDGQPQSPADIDFVLRPGDLIHIEWSGQVQAVIAARPADSDTDHEPGGIRLRSLTAAECAALAQEASRD